MTEKLLNYFKGDDLAASVWLRKYAAEGEETPDDMHKRMAKEFARVENEYINSDLEYSCPNPENLSEYGRTREDLSEDKIYNLFKDFKYIIPQGSVMSQLGVDSIGSLSNCFVIGQPEDSYGGIFQKDQEMAQLMKRRGGVGLDISTLRASGAPTTNAAKSSTGAVSFMHRFSNTTREVAQNGRRGALMLSMDVNHPDIMEFIKIKRDLSQVTGANISIKLNNEFMKAVENDEDYILRFPCDWKADDETSGLEYNELSTYYDYDGSIKYRKKIKAKEYWDEIIKSAHNVAEPGLMFWDNMVDYSPDGVYPQFKQVTTNPCSEIAMQPYDACRLIAVNLFSFVDNPFTKQAKFNFERFYQINYEAMRLSDDLVTLELEYIDRIINKIENDSEDNDVKKSELDLWNKIKTTAKNSRRTGLGFTALGDVLAALNLKYDSNEALNIVDKIMHTKMESELDCTIDLAILRGTFEGWKNTTDFLGITDGKQSDAYRGNNTFYEFLIQQFPIQVDRMWRYGRRNVSWSTVAPTGTVSLMTQTTSGIEPLFSPYYFRRNKINDGDKNLRVDFVDQNGDKWMEFPVLHPKFKDWCLQVRNGQSLDSLDKDDLQFLFEKSPWYQSTANDIDWIKRVEMQSLIQKYITHSISSTINLPSNVSEKEVSDIYLESWKKGLKGITVYRDGSRSGVLITDTTKKDNFGYTEATKRPKELDADYYFTTSKGNKYAVIVGLFNENPYEVFVMENPTSEENLKGKLVKIKKGHYSFISDKYTIENLQLSAEHQDERLLTRWVSLLLRHGANPKFVIEQVEKSEVAITNFVKVISRILKKYIPDGEKSTVSCKSCGSSDVIFQEGCMSCRNCGNSKCG